MSLPSCSASSRQRGRRRELIMDLGLVIVVVVLACTKQEDMHPAKYVFGSDGAFFFLPQLLSTPFQLLSISSIPLHSFHFPQLSSPHFSSLRLPLPPFQPSLNSSSTSIQLLPTYFLNAFNSLSIIPPRRLQRASALPSLLFSIGIQKQ